MSDAKRGTTTGQPPACGSDYPSETFRVLKTNEIARYGEYRTARLVLQLWDRMAAEAGSAG